MKICPVHMYTINISKFNQEENTYFQKVTFCPAYHLMT